jgi:hypothetical protein
MVTTHQLAAAHAFLAACGPANALLQRPNDQNRRVWQDELRTAQATRRAAHIALQDLCGTRSVYQEAIAAAREVRKVG